MKTAIYGAGSLGTVLGAYLSKAGVDVDLITRNKEHVEALNKNGAKIIGTVNMTVPVHALTPEEMTEKYELIILLTKQLDNKNILENLKKNMTDDCIVCTMQNGLPELSVSEVVGEDRTMGCTVAWGATLHGKGVSELTSEPDSLSFGLGRMNGKKDDKLMYVKSLLEKMCPVDIEDNFMGVRWSKLLINATFSGMSAVMGGTFGDAANRTDSRVCCQNLIKECIDVANAHLGKFVALNIPEPTTFKPTNIKPIEYNLKPTTAYFSSNRLFSLLNIPTIKSVNTNISKIIIADSNKEVIILSLLKILIPSLSPLP